MSTYNLLSEQKKILNIALTALIETYDQHGLKDPAAAKHLRRLINQSDRISLIETGKKSDPGPNISFDPM